ncbi:hypothetical protein SCHIN_v1c05590 [Spiroplasma chinense]|uniref:Uncharacterized protein n=1 Tax=Spiroplasma chinense TaxID=216932 RepID=A0A5B9Y4Y5_9MOLU|nr:hypothetical protein [Spiroplasma chinense]QEH61756.1 hypothetical protein SCHIN_v1c05590 [Spiroplasma chinense]
MLTKFKEYFTTKVKLKIIIFSVLSGLLFLLSFLMIVPGMGLESKSFIDSIETQIKKIMPKETYVVSGNDPAYNEMMNNVIQGAYLTDVQSTLNSYDTEPGEYAALREQYEKFAKDWYQKTWGDHVANKKDLDLYDLGMDLVKFDKAVSTEFFSFGYVNAGIAWFFHSGGIKDIFSKERYNDALRNQTMVDQDEYNKTVVVTSSGIELSNVSASKGAMLLNNKTWFLNYQISNIIYGFDAMGHNVFNDPNLSVETMPKSSMDISELYVPNFTGTLQVLRAGIVLFLIYMCLILPLYIFAMVMLIKNRKKGN